MLVEPLNQPLNVNKVAYSRYEVYPAHWVARPSVAALPPVNRSEP